MPTKAQANKENSAPTAEAVHPPTDPSLLNKELDDLSKPGRVSKGEGDFIDGDPGYSKDQLLHMREYYGLKESTADVADV